RTGGDATDAPALAPGARASQVGAAATKSGPSTRRSPGARTRAALRAREPTLGLPADRRRAAEARPACVAEHDQAHPAHRPLWAGAEAFGPELAAIPAPASNS